MVTPGLPDKVQIFEVNVCIITAYIVLFWIRAEHVKIKWYIYGGQWGTRGDS